MVFSATAQAQDGPPPGPPPHGGPGEHGPRRGGGARFGGGSGFEMLLGRAGEHLGVSKEQQEKLRTVLEGARDNQRTLRVATQEARKALADLAGAETVDEAAIRAQATKLANAEADLALAQAKIAAQVREVLTPEQLAQLKEMRDKRQHRGPRGERGDRGDRGPRGGGPGDDAPQPPPAEPGEE